MGVLKEDYLDTLEWMSEELEDEVGDPACHIPIDKMDCDIVYSINPREVKYDPRSISDAAKIFYYAGENWTMPSEGWDMTNFGLFSGDDDLGGAVARRLFEKVSELRGKKLVISECGHGYRSTRCEGQNWGQWDVDFVMESSVDTMLRYIKEGRIKVDKTKNTIPVTFHDSCNNARSCGLYEEPRELLNLVCSDFREMYPNRAENFCCTGGGGAMSMSEYTPRRLKSARIKAEQLKATGAKTVVTSCHNCVDGLSDCIKHYKLGMEVTQLVNLVANAIVPVERKKIVEVKAPEVVADDKDKQQEQEPLTGYRILVVEDEPDQATFITMVLQDNGAETLTATDGEEALELARRERPDLMTLDLSMPGKSGIDVYATMREDPELSGVPVMIITGKPEMRKTLYSMDVPPPDGYLGKPVPEETLVVNVRKILEIKDKDAN
jgi:CheY-like chemotaxis protein